MAKETRFENYRADDAKLVLVAFGSVGRILKTSVDMLREKGLAVGLLRPITVYPFPHQAVQEAAERTGHLMVVELNTGQMVEDVRLAVEGRAPVDFYGRPPAPSPPPTSWPRKWPRFGEREVSNEPQEKNHGQDEEDLRPSQVDDQKALPLLPRLPPRGDPPHAGRADRRLRPQGQDHRRGQRGLLGAALRLL